MFVQVRQDRRFALTFWTGMAFILVYAVICALVLGGERFFDYHTTLLPILFVLLADVQLGLLLRRTESPQQRRIWRWWFWGTLCWVVAETIWFVAEVLLAIDLPYPSPADAFWLAGYGLILRGLIAQIRLYGVPLGSGRRRLLTAVSALAVAVVVGLVLPPIVRDFSIARWVEGLLDVLYPLLDLALLLLTFTLVLTLGPSYAREAWLLIAAGFGIIATSDLLFVGLTWHDLYYPEDEYTLLSIVTDYLYIVGYLVWALGFYAYRVLQRMVSSAPAVQVRARREVSAPSKNRALVFTNAQGKVIEYTPVLEALADVEEGMLLEQILPSSVVRMIAQRLQHEDFLPGLPVTLRHKDGTEIPARVYAQAVRYGGEWWGMNLLLECYAPVARSDDLSEEQRRLAEHMLHRAGELERALKEGMHIYLTDMVNACYREVLTWAGPLVARKYLADLATAAREQGWAIRLDEEGTALTYPDTLDTQALRQVVVFLTRHAREVAAHLVTEEAIAGAVAAVVDALPEDVRALLAGEGLLEAA